MPRYVAMTELTRTYERSMLKREDEPHEDAFAEFLGRDDFPDDPHSDWIMVDAGSTVVGDTGGIAVNGYRRASVLRTIRIKRPMAIHARNPKDVHAVVQQACASWRDDMPSKSIGDLWYLRDQEIAVLSVSSDKGAVRTNPRFEVDFAKVIAPDFQSCGLRTDEAFELLRWMIGASSSYERRENWYTHHAHMSMNGDKGTSPEIGSVTSGNDLRRRIVGGVLSQGHDLYREWREDHGVTPTARMTIEAPTYGNRAQSARNNPSGQWRSREPLEMMREAPGLKLRSRLNQYHPGACLVRNLGVRVRPDEFVVMLEYGFDDERTTSSWGYELARSRGREPFMDVFDRAVGRLLGIVPDWDDQIQRRRTPYITNKSLEEAA